MNPKLQKTIADIERTKAKISELQELLPELERQKTDLENTEIIKAVRSAYVKPGDVDAFIASLRVKPPTNIKNEREEIHDEQE
ncbi:MAG: DUF4315 family protein [Oscillospiraceae bacterium]|jgi:hypothetical protein|nr:DUF4315 family protein [Oscillospiraceae bacterium]